MQPRRTAPNYSAISSAYCRQPRRCAPSLEGRRARFGGTLGRGLSSSGFDTKLDTARLNVAEEIVKILQGARTYECHKTVVSFEAVRRTSSRIAMGTNPNAVTLATHLCSTMHLFETPDMAPAYWGKPKPIQEYEGVPF
jgi:hypothetical protein